MCIYMYTRVYIRICIYTVYTYVAHIMTIHHHRFPDVSYHLSMILMSTTVLAGNAKYIERVVPSGEDTENYVKSPCLRGNSTINGHVQWLSYFTKG